jgi:hypothetical protein
MVVGGYWDPEIVLVMYEFRMISPAASENIFAALIVRDIVIAVGTTGNNRR